jgi:hypothetical protein
MTTTGPAIFFDGRSSARQHVTIEVQANALDVRGEDGNLLAQWPYGEIEQLASHAGVLRIGRYRSPNLTRIEIHDPAFAHIIDERAVGVDRTGAAERKSRRRVALWAIAAAASLFLAAVYGVPAIADKLAPVLPYWVDARLGAAVDAQTRAMLDPSGGADDCGAAPSEKAGRDALDALTAKLRQGSSFTEPLKIAVIRNAEANAMALPGGIIYVFQGLIDKSESPDELAGVIAHEIGHVVHRDGTRSILQAAGLSFLFGMVLGDFVGGSAVIMASRQILEGAYSREVEAAADRYATDVMNTIGADTRAFGRILSRIAGAIEPGVKILTDHPDTRERVAIIEAVASPARGAPLLDAVHWAALRRICSAR